MLISIVLNVLLNVLIGEGIFLFKSLTFDLLWFDINESSGKARLVTRIYLNEQSAIKIVKMDYYRVQDGESTTLQATNLHTADTASLLNMASDSYAPDYWNIPYSNGLSPMKQIEGECRIISMIT